MAIHLEEICSDGYEAMICAGYMRIKTLKDRATFEAANFTTDVAGPFRATEYAEKDSHDNFEIWADDPQFHS